MIDSKATADCLEKPAALKTRNISSTRGGFFISVLRRFAFNGQQGSLGGGGFSRTLMSRVVLSFPRTLFLEHEDFHPQACRVPISIQKSPKTLKQTLLTPKSKWKSEDTEIKNGRCAGHRQAKCRCQLTGSLRRCFAKSDVLLRLTPWAPSMGP